MLSKSGFSGVFTLLGMFWALGICPVSGADWKSLPGHVPRVIRGLTPIGPVPATNELQLAIGLPLRDAAGLNQFLAAIANPASPNYRHYLTPEEFTARFGPTEADYAAVKMFAREKGFTITATHGNRLLLDVAGNASAVERAFHLHLQKFRHPTESREFFAPDVEPSVAALLPVADVAGLSDYVRPQARLHHAEATVAAGAAPKSGSGSGGNFLGNDFRNAYVPGTTLTGAGQMVGLLEFDGYYAGDIIAYENLLPGSPQVTVQPVLLDGFSGTPTTGRNSGNDEVSLDIEMVIGMAPGLSQVVVYEAGPNGFQNDVLNAMAANTQIKQFSCSWGWGGGPATTTENIFMQMAAQGQSFFNAAGDSDAFTTGANSVNGVDNDSIANAPSSSPNITEVGGTTLTMNGAGNSFASETVWNAGGGTGSSGGISSYFSIPIWQQGVDMTMNGGSTTQRNIPDVAINADNTYVTYGNGRSGIFTGTSIAAPLWAGLLALVNQQAAAAGNPSAGFINPAIYALGQSAGYNLYFHDTTVGNNFWSASPNEFSTTTGYDLCTGWGTPNGTNLINALAGQNSTGTSVDTTPPSLNITSPANNLKWSNAVFTVSGTAADNVAVSNVFYSLNGAGWLPAVTTNNWINWAANVTLASGTNIIQAYAEDPSGNVSPTSLVTFVCVLTAPLTVSTNGRGSLSPNYNNALLQIGASYALTATAATGFKFTSWTDANNNVVTNGTTLRFVMASNLVVTANFADITPPTNGISSPIPNQHLSNAVFVVTGKAGDNVGVADVFYSMNGVVWQTATSANGWSNWTAFVWLTPGTNTIQAYAVDGAGNVSPTNKVSFVYILSAPLTVSTNGRGSISPNYNNALLQIGASYTLTATAATGFKFTNWLDENNDVVTNGATLKFMMASDLAFTANFADNAPPSNGIISPTANQRWSNAVFTVAGKAGDNVAVANVFYSLNGTGWQPAATTNGWTNWTAGVVLTPGTNTIQAFAIDGAGNLSATNKLSFVYVLVAPLMVSTNGRGSISPNENSALLQLGANYTLTATAAAGFKFTNWTDANANVVTNSSTLKFVMASNLAFVANFVDSAPPTLSVTAPVNAEHWSNYVLTISGKAGDNVAVANLFYSLNGSDWQPAATANGWTNWSALVNLLSGTNTVWVCATDAAGNVSATNKVSVVFVFALGGLWNTLQFQTPSQMTWDADNGLVGGNDFGEINGTIAFNPDGTLNGQFEDDFTGSYFQGSNGIVATTIVTSGTTNEYSLFINPDQDAVTLLNSRLDANNNQQELILFQRAPATNSWGSMAGAWNGLRFQTPAQMVWDPVNGLQGGTNFTLDGGTLTLNANGTASGNLAGAFTGTFQISSNGLVNLATVAGGQTNFQTLFVNASRSMMSLVAGPSVAPADEQQLILFLRQPASAQASDVMGSWNVAQLQAPAQMVWDAVNGLNGGTNFGATTGVLNFLLNGAISGNLNGPVTGSYRVSNTGILRLNLLAGGATTTVSLFLNASKDALMGEWVGGNQQQILLLQRMPAN
jgi:subtilase family serine protease